MRLASAVAAAERRIVRIQHNTSSGLVGIFHCVQGTVITGPWSVLCRRLTVISQLLIEVHSIHTESELLIQVCLRHTAIYVGTLTRLLACRTRMQIYIAIDAVPRRLPPPRPASCSSCPPSSPTHHQASHVRGTEGSDLYTRLTYTQRTMRGHCLGPRARLSQFFRPTITHTVPSKAILVF